MNAAGLWSSKRATSTRASGLLTMVLDVFTTWCYDVDRLVLAVQVVVIGFARVMSQVSHYVARATYSTGSNKGCSSSVLLQAKAAYSQRSSWSSSWVTVEPKHLSQQSLSSLSKYPYFRRLLFVYLALYTSDILYTSSLVYN